MIWLLTEILVYVLAAAVFGLLIGMGLAGSARRGAAPSRDQLVQLEELQQVRAAQRQIEAKAHAMAAAEAAARGDLEARLVDAEATMLEFRSRAESAELRLRALQNPAEAPPAALAGPDAASAEGPDTATLRAAVEAAERARAAAEAEQRQAEQQREAALEAAARSRDEARAVGGLMAQEIESLRAQLAAAEAMRSASESALATLRAEGEASMPPPPAPPPPAPPSSAMPALEPA
ncbi:MAG: hypothetical protein KIT16_18745, partial [Rhodospirillaceae bacterium]|nr:hypothetical protein [Rhodospirillaceae bacterium]